MIVREKNKMFACIQRFKNIICFNLCVDFGTVCLYHLTKLCFLYHVSGVLLDFVCFVLLNGQELIQQHISNKSLLIN